jgi:hypothetical protein
MGISLVGGLAAGRPSIRSWPWLVCKNVSTWLGISSVTGWLKCLGEAWNPRRLAGLLEWLGAAWNLHASGWFESRWLAAWGCWNEVGLAAVSMEYVVLAAGRPVVFGVVFFLSSEYIVLRRWEEN